MKRLLLGSIVLCGLGAASIAHAADRALPAAPVATLPAAWTWQGFYFGLHAGTSIANTSFTDPFGTSMFGDRVASPGFLGGGQVGYNWVVAPGWIVGVEGDGSLLSSDGTNTCLQFSPNFVGSTCKVDPRALGTLTGRAGFTIGPAGRTLLYGKAGLAVVDDAVAVQGNNNFGLTPSATNKNYAQWGWTLGAGVEQALTPAWSLKLEYDYMQFANHGVATPASNVVDPNTGDFDDVGPSASTAQQAIHAFKIGMNYHWGADPATGWSVPAVAPAYPVKALYKAPPPVWFAGWEGEIGGRYWVSSGKFQWDNFSSPDVRISRLTYDKLNGQSGEVFGRVDTPFNVFVKGFVGSGSITRGRMNDEDWGLHEPGDPIYTGYTNTLSDPVKGPISYFTGDLGYDLQRGPGYKAGPFVGYNYFKETANAFNCQQMANAASGICAPAVAPGTLTITETARWQSLRVGYAAETMLVDRVKISGDIAYLPYVAFEGRDDHWLRATPTNFLQRSQAGQGVQTEVILSYLVTPNFSLGIGGRYWAMWTAGGSFVCNGCTGISVTLPPVPSKNNTERFGMFFQGSYLFDTSGVAAAGK
jgi:opacity protein-like surface antigen